MLNSLQQRYNEMAVRILGYTVAIHFEEFVLLLAGIFIGGIIVGIIATRFIMRIRHIDNSKEKSKINMMRVSANGKNWYTLKLGSFVESFRQFFLVLFSMPFTKKRFAEEDKRRTRIFITFLVIAMIAVLIFAYFAINSDLKPEDAETIKLIYEIM